MRQSIFLNQIVQAKSDEVSDAPIRRIYNTSIRKLPSVPGGQNLLFPDPDRIGSDLERDFAQVQACLEQKDFSRGLALGRRLLSLRIIFVIGRNSQELTVRDLCELDLVHADVRDLLHDTLCCAFLGAAQPGERARAVWDVVRSAQNLDPYLRPFSPALMMQEAGKWYADFCFASANFLIPAEDAEHREEADPSASPFYTILSSVLSECEENPRERDAFAIQWLDTITRQLPPLPQRHFQETMRLFPDEKRALLCMASYIGGNFFLLNDFLRRINALPAKFLFQYGVELLHVMEESGHRSDLVCIQTASRTFQALIASDSPDREQLDVCDTALFRYRNTPVNYLRALVNARDPEWMRARLHGILRSNEERLFGERRWDGMIHDIQKELVLFFLDGQFFPLLRRIQGLDAPDGWAEGIFHDLCSLFLLYFCSADAFAGTAGAAQEDLLPPGIREMLRRADHALGDPASRHREDFLLPAKEGESDEHFLREILCRWKELFPLSEADQREALQLLDHALKKRVDYVMRHTLREEYASCAALIAAHGEVLQSRGLMTKQKLMNSYYRTWPKSRIFVSALKQYGWEKPGRSRR